MLADAEGSDEVGTTLAGGDRTRREPAARDDRSVARAVEFFSVSLIALTAVLAAWSAFEASKWGGVMSIRFSEASAVRTESVRQSDLASSQRAVDVGLFVEYVGAVARDETELAEFYLDRFPDRLATATEDWLATRPLVDAGAPSSPFDMPSYVVAPAAEAEELEERADERAAAAREANQRSDNYTITSVFLATVLLLAALSTKVDSVRLQRGMLVAATLVFVGTASVIATFPIEV